MWKTVFCTLCLLPWPGLAENCRIDSFPEFPDVSIRSAETVEKPVSHCKVSGVIGPEIRFELLLPIEWNGKFAMGGGGGFVGSVQNMALRLQALEMGYATAGTDTGHRSNGLDASWALDNLERLVNFGHQAVHRTAVTSKALVSAYYGRVIERNYFVGCSRGGGQALMEVQRYPEDFDGVVAGAPAFSWTGLAGHATKVQQAMFPDPADLGHALISPREQNLLGEAILARCDAEDGLEDDILNDPSQCDFSLDALPRCESFDTEECFTQQELDAVASIYSPLRSPDGRPIFAGFPFGAEMDERGWQRWQTGGLDYEKERLSDGREVPQVPNLLFGFSNGIMKYFVFNDPSWDYSKYSDASFLEETSLVAATLNADDPDLANYRARGGKLLIYHGWSDAALSALATIDYYDEVLAQDAKAREDVRLFLLPGVLHCFGGKGPSFVNYLTVIDDWVETGDAPDQIDAIFLDGETGPAGGRPICAYPNIAKYAGRANDGKELKFSCPETQ